MIGGGDDRIQQALKARTVLQSPLTGQDQLWTRVQRIERRARKYLQCHKDENH